MHRIRALNNHNIPVTIFINFYQLTVVCKIYSEFFISDLKEMNSSLLFCKNFLSLAVAKFM